MNLKSNIQLTNNKRKHAITVKDIVICGLFAAVLLVTQVTLAALPNIELVSLLVIVYTLIFGKKTIPIIYIFALLEGLLYVLVTQVTLAALPNIELVSLLVIVYTLIFGKKTIPIIYIFALLEGLLYGFGYTYIW